RHGIECDFEPTGELTVLLEPYQEAWDDELLRAYGHDVVLLDGEAMRAEVHSPIYRGGIWDRTGAAVLDPGKLCAGLRDAALRLGVRVYEPTAAASIDGDIVLTPSGRVRARRTLLATSAYPPLVRSLRRYVVPVYDYALVIEPLSAAQRESIGWERRQ